MQYILEDNKYENTNIQKENNINNIADKYMQLLQILRGNNNQQNNITFNDLQNMINNHASLHRDTYNNIDNFMQALQNMDLNNFSINEKDLQAIERALDLKRPELFKRKDFRDTFENVKTFILEVSKILLQN
jgi:hypothetical protein